MCKFFLNKILVFPCRFIRNFQRIFSYFCKKTSTLLYLPLIIFVTANGVTAQPIGKGTTDWGKMNSVSNVSNIQCFTCIIVMYQSVTTERHYYFAFTPTYEGINMCSLLTNKFLQTSLYVGWKLSILVFKNNCAFCFIYMNNFSVVVVFFLKSFDYIY